MKPSGLFLLAVCFFIGVVRTQAQVVHLPTFQSFGISTTVSVPDRGGAYLGGVSRSSTGRTLRGLPMVSRMPFAGRPLGNRAIAGSSQSSGVSVSAYVHDFENMDEELLGQAQAIAPREARRPSLDSGGRTSIADLRRQQAIQQAAQHAAEQAEARADFDRANELLKQGKAGVAKVYLQRAAKRADPELRAAIAGTMQRFYVTAPLAQTAIRE